MLNRETKRGEGLSEDMDTKVGLPRRQGWGVHPPKFKTGIPGFARLNKLPTAKSPRYSLIKFS